MAFLRQCKSSISVKYASVFKNLVGFQSGLAKPTRFTSSATFPSVKISDGPKTLLGFGYGQKLPNLLGHYCVGRTQNSKKLLGFESFSMLRLGTRHYSVVQESRNTSRHCVGTRHYSVHMFQDYLLRHLLKFLSCVAFFTGRFETVPFTTKNIYVFPFVDQIRGEIFLRSWNDSCKKGMLLPRTHPHCVRIELIVTKILEALQRETGTRHMLADQQWLKEYDDGEVESRRKQNDKNTTAHLKEGIDWEFYVAKDPRVGAGSINIGMNKGVIVLFRRLFDCYKTDAELAVVIAHEVGHVLFRHGQCSLTWFPLSLYHRLIHGSDPKPMYYLCDKHEADFIGMIISAYAGYDPRVAPMAVEKMKLHLRLVPETAVAISRAEIERRIKFMTRPNVMPPVVRIYEERMEVQGSN